MKYVQPYGINDPNASYINGDPSIARQGSIPPAEAFEHPMRELVAIIEDSQIAPSELDLTQAAKGIRSQRMNYVEDTGSVNTLSVALDPPLATYTVGLPIRVKIANTNTGPSTIDAGAGRVSIKKPTGAEMASGDLPAAGLAEMVFDGTNFQMINFGGAGGTGGSITLVNIPYTVDSSTTANTIIANFSPAITSLVPGSIMMVKIANTNTNFTNMNVNGLGLKSINALGGSPGWPLLPSDVVKNDVVIFMYDGTKFWFTANTILDQSVGFTVANNADFDAIFLALGRKRILASGYVTITMAAGVWGKIHTSHPNAERICVQGTMLAAVPVQADFARTGNSAAARAQDAANNLAMLRSRHGTEIRFQNVIADMGGAVTHSSAGQILFQNLLIVGQGVLAPGAMAAGLSGFAIGFAAASYCNNCTVWGSGGWGWIAGGSAAVNCNNCFAVNCGTFGFYAVGGAFLSTTGSGAYGNTNCGYYADRGGNIEMAWRPHIDGTADVIQSHSQCNANAGVAVNGQGVATMANGIITSNGIDASAAGGSVINLSGVWGTTSPAVNTVGNGNAIINA